MPTHEVINVCSTPNILKILSSKARKIVISQKDLRNSIISKENKTKGHTEGHEIPKQEIYKLSKAIRNPIMVLKGNKRNENSVIILTELLNKDGDNIFVPISLDRHNGKISDISTMYGKKNLSSYLLNNMSKILAVNIKKADMFANIGNQYSKSIYDTVNCFDDSIAYTIKNVKYPQKNNTRSDEKMEENIANTIFPEVVEPDSPDILTEIENRYKVIENRALHNLNANISDVVTSMPIPEAAVEMEVNPNFNSIFTEDNFRDLNNAVEELSEEVTTDKARENISETEKISERSSEVDEMQAEAVAADEITSSIIAQRYTDTAQVNSDIVNDLETGDISVSQQQEQTENDAELSDDGENDIMLALHKAADEKDANAMNILGVCYMTGMNVAIDEVKALNYFKQATELENVSAMRNLAIVLENNAEPDSKQAAELYSKAADNGDRFAQNNLGVCYLMGDGVEKNVRKAVQYFEKAVKSGDDYAMVNLADCYSIGNGVRKNDKKAFDLYKQAADKGNIAGIKAVADSLYKGIGTKQDFSEAMKFYKMAADRGDEASKAMYEMIQSKTSGQKHDIKSETTIAASKESTKTDKNNAEKVKQHKNREAR